MVSVVNERIEPIKKCMFLVAGYGTRFLPATKVMPKEMMPILDKPLVQYGVEEAYEAGLTEIAFVTGRRKRAIEDHFDTNMELEAHLKGDPREKSLDDLRELIAKCTFSYTRQSEILGPGHAVKTGKILTSNEPFGVVLSDDLCFGTGKGVLAQMLDVYNEYRCCVIAVERVSNEDTDKYGIIEGSPIASNLFDVGRLVEKPSAEEAPSDMGIVGRYILTPDIFADLEKIEPGVGGEYQLTDALDRRAREGRVLALEFSGERFDCGSIEGFVQATNYCYERSMF